MGREVDKDGSEAFVQAFWENEGEKSYHRMQRMTTGGCCVFQLIWEL